MRPVFAGFGIAALMVFGSAANGQAQPASPTTSVQIVNATSVPAITLKLNDAVLYNSFPQGSKTGDAPIPVAESVYQAEDQRTGRLAKSDKIKFEPWGYQSLVIFGDFSDVTPRQSPRTPSASVMNSSKVFFQVFSHSAVAPPVRLRVINGLPDKDLTFVSGNKETIVKPGEHAVLPDQPATAEYSAKVDGESIPVLMRQEGLIRNAMVVFFLKGGKPTFMRAFENTAESNRKRLALEKQQ